jgi:hypothetical protein
MLIALSFIFIASLSPLMPSKVMGQRFVESEGASSEESNADPITMIN